MDESNPTLGLTIRRVALDSLHLDPANARAHGESNLDAIEASLKRFGQAEPLVVHKETGRVIGGNGRLVAMRKLGWSECDVVEVGVDPIEATALGIALNRTAELAAWDEPALASLLEGLRTEDALTGVGFTDLDIDELLAELQAEVGTELDDPGPEEPPQDPVSRTGDLWILGDHRLLCGDSTVAEDMARLMGDAQAALLATDPPYLVDYQGEGWDGFQGDDEGVAFYTRFLAACLLHCRPDAAVYQWHAHRRQALVQRAWGDSGLLVHQQIIWAKASGTFGRSHYMWQHEPCFYGWPQGKMPAKARRPEPSCTTVWQVDQVGQHDADHPTQKPVELFARPIQYHTLPGEVCLEPFSGSGTQLIAAEGLGRACHAMEKNPGYVDVAINRWERATGREAVLDGGGRPFAQVAEERGHGTKDS